MNRALLLLLLPALALSPAFGKEKPGEDPAVKIAEAREYRERYQRELAPLSPAELVRLLNSPLPESHAGLRAAFRPGHSYLILHAFEPGIPLDFRTATAFRDSIVNHNGLLGASGFDDIGHVFVGWSCDSGHGPAEGMAAMTGERNFQASRLLKAGWGLTAFLATFTDGHLQPPSFLGSYDSVMADPFDAHVVAFEVPSDQCERARDFVRSYAEHPSRPSAKFGLNLDPRQFEGGGCGSFGAAVLEKSGLFGSHNLAAKWWRTLRPNPSLLGSGLPLPEQVAVPSSLTTRKHKVPAPSLFLGLHSGWDNPGKRGLTLKLLDPELLQLSLKTIYRRLARPIVASSPRLGQEFYRSSIAKLRKVKTLPPAGKGNALVETPIDRTFDRQAKAVVEATDAWLKSADYTARLVPSGKGSAILVELK